MALGNLLRPRTAISAGATYLAARAGGVNSDAVLKQAGVAGAVGAVAAPGAGALVNAGRNAYAVAVGHSAVSNAASQAYLKNGSVSLTEVGVAAVAAVPAAAVESVAGALGASQLATHTAGTQIGASVEFLANGVFSAFKEPDANVRFGLNRSSEDSKGGSQDEDGDNSFDWQL